MIFIPRQEPFLCENCGTAVKPLKTGSYRNHCPKCLWSKHVDLGGPGDRQSPCRGLMKPIGLEHRGGKGWMIVHRCTACGEKRSNTAACDDDLTVLPSGISSKDET